MLLLTLLIAAAISVPLAGGRLRNLADVRLDASWTLLVALGLQVLTISVMPGMQEDWAQTFHLFSYCLAAWFLFRNRKVPGLWLIGIGGAMNLIAITSNGGTMPAAPSALATAGLTDASNGFTNSQTLVNPTFAWLGDIFAVPSSWPVHNVFSLGDVCIALGAALALHLVGRSKLIPSGKGQFTGLAQHPNFIKLWFAQAISNLGDWVYALAVGVTIVERTGSAHAVAFLLIAQVGPAALTGFLGGPLIDRFPRKAVMLVSDLMRAAALISLLLADGISTGHLYVVAASLGVFEALFQPSLLSSLPNLVPKNRLVAANALVTGTFNMSVMVGPLLGGLLVAQFGLTSVLTLNATSFLVSAFLVARVRIPHRARPKHRPSARRDLVEGFRYVAATPLVRGVLIVTGLVMFGVALRSPLEPLFVLETLGEEPGALGLVGGAWGLGMLVGTLAAPAAARRWPRERLLALAIGLVGACVLVASQAQALSLVLLLWLFAGAANTLGTVSYESLLQERTPDELRGRVMAASETMLNLAYLGGASTAGWLGAAAGLRGAYLVSGSLFLMTGVLAGRLIRVRREAAAAPGTAASSPTSPTGATADALPGRTPASSGATA